MRRMEAEQRREEEEKKRREHEEAERRKQEQRQAGENMNRFVTHLWRIWASNQQGADFCSYIHR